MPQDEYRLPAVSRAGAAGGRALVPLVREPAPRSKAAISRHAAAPILAQLIGGRLAGRRLAAAREAAGDIHAAYRGRAAGRTSAGRRIDVSI